MLRQLIYITFISTIALNLKAIDIERFEHIDTKNGLSQNNVLSIYCDHKGFLWLGTMDGLNRYDGYEFKVYKSKEGNTHSLTNNRISNIWQDSLNFLWVQTYEGYYHYLSPENENFITYPKYLKSDVEKSSQITFFHQVSKTELWLGSNMSGAYYLKYNPDEKRYDYRHFSSKGKRGISSNSVNFIDHDAQNNIWIGTNNGLDFLANTEVNNSSPALKHYYPDYSFTSTVAINNKIYFGTKDRGLIIYDRTSNNFIEPKEPLSDLTVATINNLGTINDSLLIISSDNNGLYIFNRQHNKLYQYKKHGNLIKSFFVDKENNIWTVTNKFGIGKVNPFKHTQKTYNLTPKEIEPLIDDERLFLFEDSKGNLWIGTHGAGLFLYNKQLDKFDTYTNTPNQPGTLSSNFVHCIGEDNSGLLWVGTGQFNGGVNKIVTSTATFKQITPKKNIVKLSENVVRSLMQDSNGKIWVSTKSGHIYIYNNNWTLNTELHPLKKTSNNFPGYNVYCIYEDNKGHIWMGTKGGGLLNSKQSISGLTKYDRLLFKQSVTDPTDSSSLSSNSIYSILQDNNNDIWISTYGGGLDKVINKDFNNPVFRRFNPSNSNLTSNEVRNLFEDREGNIWIGTTFGLNLLTNQEKQKKHPRFQSFLNNPEDINSLSYNDVIHIFQDHKENIWLGTFGGGLNLLQKKQNNYVFKHYNSSNGLINDAVFAVTEDVNGRLWLSTEKGLSMFNPNDSTFENYDINSGLFSENFSENTACTTNNGKIVFGSTNGLLIVDPNRIEKSHYTPPVYILNFQLNNRDVEYNSPDSPIKSNIETLDHIVLKYYQSSFSFEYAALSFFAPNQNGYKFILENFDHEWNDVGNQRKATYTNISPGEYVFKVKASNWDGTWNPEATTLKITITPPWWRSPLAYWVYILLSIVIILITRRIFLNYYKMHNDLLVERRVNDIKLQFFTNISHEIRTPLTLIMGPIEDIKNMQKLPTAISDRLRIMDRNAKRMLRLINQLLDFRKIQKEKMDLIVQKTELIQFISEIAEHFTPLAQQKKIDFSFKSQVANIEVYIDIRKFDSVIFNVLSNAFKYSPANSQIKLEIILEDNGFANIVVTDEGPGIPENKTEVLFQRFSTINAGYQGSFEGSGIGLNLSYEIMKLHNGDITVESKLNTGSKFTIKLPLGKEHFSDDEIKENKEIVRHQLTPIIPENIEIDDEKEIRSLRKILLVEDNHEIIIYLKSILKGLYEIKSANNGNEGLDRLNEYHPDLIITDIMMPEMNGIDFTKQVKKNIELSHIPVIMLTAKPALEDQIEGIESGAESYLLKPFNANLLKAVVSNLLKQRENILKKYSEKDYTKNLEIKVTAKDDDFMQSIVKIIDENYNNPEFNVEKLVELSTVSRTLLYNKLKGLTGLSPVEFIRQLRLKYAATILVETGRGVSETAYLTGFNDIKYFRKCFKDLFGMSPKEYQQTNNGKA